MSSNGTAHAGPGPVSSQYAAAAIVPLIKAPTLWLPRPVEMPSDVHPLPDDIGAYFVYPFTLEPHVLSSDPPVHERIRAQRRELAEMLEQRRRDEENRRKDTLRRIAPGYNPTSFLMPASPLRATSSSPQTPVEKQTSNALAEDLGSAGSGASDPAAAPATAEDPEDAFRSLKI